MIYEEILKCYNGVDDIHASTSFEFVDDIHASTSFEFGLMNDLYYDLFFLTDYYED